MKIGMLIKRVGFLAGIVLLLVLSLVTISSAQVCVQAPEGLLGWWTGDGNANDIVGANNGTLEDGATFASGFVGQAFDLNGSDNYIRIADNPSLDTPDGFTVDAWIYPRAFGGAKDIAAKWDDPTGQWSWIFKLHNDGSGRLRVEISRGDHNTLGDLAGSTILPLNTWSHVAASYDRQTGRIRLYLNGQVDSESFANFPDAAVNNSAADLLIGAVNGQIMDPGEFFNGLIDELELFNRALSPEEIQAIFAAGQAGKCKATTLVTIDIKPGSFPNSINLSSNGTVPVAILSTPDFDATTVDPASVTLASAPVRLKGQGTFMASHTDINGDGLSDLLVHVVTQALVVSEYDTEAVLEGRTMTGIQIMGNDSIRVVR